MQTTKKTLREKKEQRILEYLSEKWNCMDWKKSSIRTTRSKSVLTSEIFFYTSKSGLRVELTKYQKTGNSLWRARINWKHASSYPLGSKEDLTSWEECLNIAMRRAMNTLEDVAEDSMAILKEMLTSRQDRE